MKKAIILLFATLIVSISSAASFAMNDRNNELACAERDSMDSRCY